MIALNSSDDSDVHTQQQQQQQQLRQQTTTSAASVDCDLSVCTDSMDTTLDSAGETDD